ncbi:hypothetical protein GDO78_005058 [Eleutherodactylus coqui]|uniref:Uncharacterized protein n=1 Tax=Eleutherodactylus coqui TaxID=57060 RepID=A0A8J6FL13_ELECQ|nr:hypothetical protein GDO78_005058 [Eleutherodactylus coqui]
MKAVCHTKGLFFNAFSLPVPFYTGGRILTKHLNFVITNYAKKGCWAIYLPLHNWNSISQSFMMALFGCSGDGAPYGKSCIA